MFILDFLHAIVWFGSGQPQEQQDEAMLMAGPLVSNSEGTFEQCQGHTLPHPSLVSIDLHTYSMSVSLG
jgi:hypothetical protein